MSVTQTTPRKVRCRVSIVDKRGRNPCSNEQLDDYGLCLRHLEEASAHWAGIVANVIDKLAPDEDRDKLRAVVDTLRKYSGATL